MRILFTISILCFAGLLLAQQGTLLEGVVSYVSSQNVYVKFASTSGIETGDTLWQNQAGILSPCLLVKDKSSTSCVCSSLIATPIEKGEKFIAYLSSQPVAPSSQSIPPTPASVAFQDTLPSTGAIIVTPETESAPDERKEKISGRISAASYSNLYEGRQTHRMRYAFILRGEHISRSKISIDNYITFRHTAGEWNEVQANVFDALKIYNLSVRYDLSSQATLTMGRKINPRISNMGAVDVQYEQQLGKIMVGLLEVFALILPIIALIVSCYN
ncbi:MAG: hypothetical protein R2795_22125 [Saprospiraceae bacterium]